MEETEKYEALQREHNALKEHHAGVMASFHPLQVKLDEALQKHKDDEAAHAQEIAALNQAHEVALISQAAELNKQHEDAIVKLKATILVPALKDMQARQAADLAAKHEAELAELR